MSDEIVNVDSGEVTSDDRLWAALAWLPITPIWPIIAIIVLLMEDKKVRPFIRYNAILSLIIGAVGFILLPVCVGMIIIIAMFYFAYKAYVGERVRIPALTDFIENQGWV